MNYPTCDIELGIEIQKGYEEHKRRVEERRRNTLTAEERRRMPWLPYRGAEGVQLQELHYINDNLKDIASSLRSIEKKLTQKEEE